MRINRQFLLTGKERPAMLLQLDFEHVECPKQAPAP